MKGRPFDDKKVITKTDRSPVSSALAYHVELSRIGIDREGKYGEIG